MLVSVGSLKYEAMNGEDKKRTIYINALVERFIKNTVEKSTSEELLSFIIEFPSPPSTKALPTVTKIIINATRPNSLGNSSRVSKMAVTSFVPRVTMSSVAAQINPLFTFCLSIVN